MYSSGAFSFHFKNCIFKGNNAFTGGCIDVGAVTAYIENCQFLSNEGILHTGGIIGATYGVFIIHNCSFKNNRGVFSSGALTMRGESYLTILNFTFTNNTSDLRAGAILLERNATANISESTFIHNNAVLHGCIETNSNVTLQISHTYFIYNKAKTASVIFSQYNVTVEILFSKFEYNVGENSIEARQNSKLIIVNSQFSKNNISAGSVIFVYMNSKFVSRNSTFISHLTALHGAIIYGSQNSNINLMESKMQHNQANKGGVIYTVHCTLHIDNTLFDFNNATNGGAIYAMFSYVLIHNSSCNNNFAEGYGGCLFVSSSNVSLDLCNMFFNKAFAGGTVMIFSKSEFTALRTKFYNNTAVTSGGAISQ